MSDPGSPFAAGGANDPPPLRPPNSPATGSPAANWIPSAGYPYLPSHLPPAPGYGSSDIVVADLVFPEPVKRPHPHIGWAILWMLLPICAQIAGVFVAAFVAMFFIAASGAPQQQWQAKLNDLDHVMLPAATLSTLIAALAAAAFVFRRDMARKLALRGCSIGQWVLVVMLVAPLAIIGSEIGNWATEILYALDLHKVARFGEDAFDDISQQSWLLVFLSACVLPALGEEIFFRGFLSRGLVGWHGVILGSLFASTLFAVVHFFPVQVCGVFILGLGMQYLFLTTRSLLAPMLLHVLNNSLAFMAMRHGEELKIEGVTEGPEAGVVPHAAWPLLAASVAVAAAIFWVLYVCRTRWILPKGDEWSPGYFATEIPPAALGARPVTAWSGVAPALALIVACGLFVAAMVWTAQ